VLGQSLGTWCCLNTPCRGEKVPNPQQPAGSHLVCLSSAAIAKEPCGAVVDMEVRCIHEVDILPEKVGRVAVEASGHERGFPEVGGGQESEDQLQQLVRKTLNLPCGSARRRVGPRRAAGGRRTGDTGSSSTCDVATAQLVFMLAMGHMRPSRVAPRLWSVGYQVARCVYYVVWIGRRLADMMPSNARARTPPARRPASPPLRLSACQFHLLRL
jgi:hypothetical protein